MKKIVFLGDSVTDARKTDGFNQPYGTGFVDVVQNTLSFRYTDKDDVEIVNKGVGGQTLSEIRKRVKNDVIALQPEAVFIIAGVNDSWRKFDSNLPGLSDVDFRKEYLGMIDEIISGVKGVKIVLGTPYALPVNEMSGKIEKDLPAKIEIIKEIAKERQLDLIDLDAIFHQRAQQFIATDLALDGVHPAVIGCALIANEVVKIIEGWYFR